MIDDHCLNMIYFDFCDFDRFEQIEYYDLYILSSHVINNVVNIIIDSISLYICAIVDIIQ